jgi:hypothetical protein
VRVTISLLEHTFRLASLFLSPAVAVWAWRASGSVQLLAGRLSSRFGIYVVGVLSAALAWVVAVIVGVNILGAVA